jgi:DNA-binding NarL/FixJ family response regulator
VPERTRALSAALLRSVLDQLSLAIFIFRGDRLVYKNPPAARLVQRLRSKYRIELLVMLLDQLSQFRDRSQPLGTVISLTGGDHEPFLVHVLELDGRRADVAISVREIGPDIAAFKERYGLSRRELQVVELVLRGHRNTYIAATLGIAPTTTKKHLSSIFEKVGVNSRAELASRLA